MQTKTVWSLFRETPGYKRKRSDLWIAWVLIAFAAVLRFHSVAVVHYFGLYGDMIHYDQSAQLLLSHHFFSFWGGQPDAYVTPGFPIFLAICYRIAMIHSYSHDFGLHFTMYVQAILSALTTGFIYWTSRRVLSVVWAFCATMLWVAYLPSIWSVRLILTETLYVFLLMLFVWLFTIAMEKQQFVWWLMCGLSLGLTGLVRPTVFPLVLAAAVFLLIQIRQGKSWRRALLEYIAYGIGFVIPLIPWWIRNYVLLHQLVLSDTEVGNPLLFGSDPYFKSGPLLGHGLSQVAQKQLAIHRIVEGFTHQPALYAQWYTVGKLKILFGKPWFQPITPNTSAFTVFWLHLHLLWVCLGIIGVLWGFAVKHMRFISVLAVFLILIQLPFIPVNRYAFPVMPLLFVGVGLLVQRLWDLVVTRFIRGGFAT